MDKPISVGDLVVVVRGMPCCGALTKRNGLFFKVSAISPDNGAACDSCGKIGGEMHAKDENGLRFDISRLKRIPPLSELESEKRDEDLREPA
jgi:hypothetical protein